MPRRPRGSFPSPVRPPKGSFPSYTDRQDGSFPTGRVSIEPPSATSSIDSSSSTTRELPRGRAVPSSDFPSLEGRISTPRKKKPKPSYSLGTKVKIFRSCLRRRVHPFALQVTGSSATSIGGSIASDSHHMHHSGQKEDQVPLMAFMDEYEDLYYGPL